MSANKKSQEAGKKATEGVDKESWSAAGKADALKWWEQFTEADSPDDAPHLFGWLCELVSETEREGTLEESKSENKNGYLNAFADVFMDRIKQLSNANKSTITKEDLSDLHTPLEAVGSMCRVICAYSNGDDDKDTDVRNALELVLEKTEEAHENIDALERRADWSDSVYAAAAAVVARESEMREVSHD